MEEHPSLSWGPSKYWHPRLDDGVADGRLAFLDGAAPFVFPTPGLACAAVTGGALHGYRREYLVVTRRGAVSWALRPARPAGGSAFSRLGPRGTSDAP